MPAGAIRLRDYMFCHPELTTKFANTLGAWVEDDDIPWEDDDPEPCRAEIFVKPSPNGVIRVKYDGGVWELFEGAGTLRCRFTDTDLKDIESARALLTNDPTDPWREFDLANAVSERSPIELGPGEGRLLFPVREAHNATMELLRAMLARGEIEAWAHEGKMRGPVFQVEIDVVHALKFYTTETATLGADPTILWGVRLRAAGAGASQAEAVEAQVLTNLPRTETGISSQLDHVALAEYMLSQKPRIMKHAELQDWWLSQGGVTTNFKDIKKAARNVLRRLDPVLEGRYGRHDPKSRRLRALA